MLVAQQLGDDTLFAIEQVGADIFALSRIAEWVTPCMLEEVQSSEPSAKRRSISQPEAGARFEDVPWWQSASLPEDQTKSMPLNIESRRSANEDSHKNYQIINGMTESQTPKGKVSIEKSTQFTTDSAEHSLEAIRTQYQEALYTSKVPMHIASLISTDACRHRWPISQRVLSPVREPPFKDQMYRAVALKT